MKPCRRVVISLFVALPMVSACGGASNDEEALATERAPSTEIVDPTTPSPTGTTATTTPLALSPETVVPITEETLVAPAPDIDPALQTVVDQATADLAIRLAID
ncbi:MAG: hypothetical protein ABI862_20910, partial [Ilumatobacteraceae bacterium]